MKLAKDCIDIGLQTNNLEPMLAFWRDTIGLPYEELLKVGGGTHQHRLNLNGAVFKLNSIRDLLPETGDTSYSELFIAKDACVAPETLTDPDGNKVTLVPPGYQGITQVGLKMKVASISAFQHFYRHVITIDEVDASTFRWGSTLFFLEENPAHKPCQEMRGKGFRYITVQVWEVDKEHQQVVDLGGDEGSPPRTLGTTARISFIRDPDKNWIEISQRASLTGELPSNE